MLFVGNLNFDLSPCIPLLNCYDLNTGIIRNFSNDADYSAAQTLCANFRANLRKKSDANYNGVAYNTARNDSSKVPISRVFQCLLGKNYCHLKIYVNLKVLKLVA